MSWSNCDLDYTLKGTLVIEFDCPRCGHHQVHEITERDLLAGLENFYCENTAVCGNRQMGVTVFLNVDASMNGLTDVPLIKPVA